MWEKKHSETMNTINPSLSPSFQPTSVIRAKGSLPWAFVVFVYTALALLLVFAVVCVLAIIRRRCFRHVTFFKRRGVEGNEIHENENENCIIETTATYSQRIDVELAIAGDSDLPIELGEPKKDNRWQSLISYAIPKAIYKRQLSADPIIATADEPPSIAVESVRVLEAMSVDFNHIAPLLRQMGVRAMIPENISSSTDVGVFSYASLSDPSNNRQLNAPVLTEHDTHNAYDTYDTSDDGQGEGGVGGVGGDLDGHSQRGVNSSGIRLTDPANSGNPMVATVMTQSQYNEQLCLELLAMRTRITASRPRDGPSNGDSYSRRPPPATTDASTM